MKKDFKALDWEKYLPRPICEEHPEYEEFYLKAWAIAREHVKEIKGMPQTPYMDEAFCDTQIWIWDSCFMSLFCKYAQEVFPGVETLRNFYDVLYNGKELPYVIPTEKEPYWTGAIAGKPFQLLIHLADNPPLFAWAEYENALIHGDKEYLKDLIYNRQVLQKHYDWIENLTESMLLKGVRFETALKREQNGYKWEGGRSGMDNTPRGRLKNETTEAERLNNPDMLWLDAICQQALSAKRIADLFALVDDIENKEKWEEKYIEKKNIVNHLYWDDKDQFYYDIDCKNNHFYKVPTIASYWTLISEIATKERANAMVKELMNPVRFGGFVPFPSLARNDVDFDEKGQYWRGSVWLPTAYVTLKGLVEYGYYQEAQETGYQLFQHMFETYKRYEPHTIWECYSPTAYEPGMQVKSLNEIVRPDFCGWSALGPIAVYIEHVLGFHAINAFEKVVEWRKPSMFKGKVGIENLRFGEVITDIVADEKECQVKSNLPYTLKINEKAFQILEGENVISL